MLYYMPHPVLAAVLVVVLLAAAVMDVWKGRIPNAITLPAVALGLVLQTILGGWPGLAQSAAGLGVAFLPMFVFWRAGLIHGGDVKLTAAMGSLTSWPFALAAMFVVFASAAVMAIVVMVARRMVVRTLRRIGRAVTLTLAGRAGSASLSGPDSPKIPFGLAICVGGTLTLIDAMLGGRFSGGILAP